MSTGSVEILKEVQGIDFYKFFFDEGIYEDGRELNEDRPYLIKVGLDKNAAGSSFVQWQGSVVSCRVTAKAGYYDPKQCVRFKFERTNCIPKREFDFVRAVLGDFSRRHVFVNPNTLVFETEYQTQLFVTLTFNACDGFLLGAVLTAINAALSNTQLPAISASLLDDEEEMDDDAPSKRLLRRRNKFRFDTDKMTSVVVENVPHYSGFLVYKQKSDPKNSLFLHDPNEQLLGLIRQRIDIVIGQDDCIYFWQTATFDDGSITKKFRKQIMDLARERRDKASAVMKRVHEEGSADSETVE